MRKFNKNIAKEFKTSFGRFIAIMAIIALGVGFLIGVTQATPDMKNTMSTYLIDNKAYDIDVKGTFGLTQADIDAIRDRSRPSFRRTQSSRRASTRLWGGSSASII